MTKYPPLTDYIDAEGNVPLHHYSSHVSGDTVTLDPSHFAKHSYALNDRKAVSTPRLFFYVDPTERDAKVGGAHYVTKLPAKQIYDLRSDPEHLVTPDLGRTLAEVRGRGYTSIYYNTGDHGVVNHFEPITVHKTNDPVAKLSTWHGNKAWFETGNDKNRYVAHWGAGTHKVPVDFNEFAESHPAMSFPISNFMFEYHGHAAPEDDTTGILGIGHAKEAITKAAKTLLSGLHEHKPAAVYYSAEEPSRKSLYSYLTKKISQYNPDYHGYAVGSKYHVLVHKDKVPEFEKTMGDRATKVSSDPVAHLAAYKAPGGGAIVNNQYYDGGSFMPRVLGKIRDVLARKRSSRVTKLHRNPSVLPAAMTVQSLLPRGHAADRLTEAQLLRLAASHGVQAPEYNKELSNKIHVSPVELAKFLDRIAESRLPHVKSAEWTPAQKQKHLVTHMVADFRRELARNPESVSWYGDSVNKMDKGLGLLYGWHPQDPRTDLARAIVAFTSGSKTPKANLGIAMNLIEHAIKSHPTEPFKNLPTHNTNAYSDWLRAMSQHFGEHPDQIEHVGDPYEWFKKYGKNKFTKGYMAAPTIVDKATDKAVGRQSMESLIPYEGSGHTYDTLKEGLRNRTLKAYLDTPKVVNGKLHAKGWGQGAVQGHIKILNKLVTDLGEKGAAEFLRTSHPESELLKYSGRKTLARGYLAKGELVPGTFLFGPKFGPFAANMAGNMDALTADRWFSRGWNRPLGTMTDSHGAIQETPRTDSERRLMRKTTQQVAKAVGHPVATVQAVLWSADKHLFSQFGAPTDAYGYGEATDHHAATRPPVDEAIPLARKTRLPIDQSPEHQEMKDFLLAKWKERAGERFDTDPNPTNLSGACKFVARFANKVLGGKLRSNFDHTWVEKDGKIIDLTDNVDKSNYKHDAEFHRRPEFLESLKSNEPRVNQWVSEWNNRGAK